MGARSPVSPVNLITPQLLPQSRAPPKGVEAGMGKATKAPQKGCEGGRHQGVHQGEGTRGAATPPLADPLAEGGTPSECPMP